MEKWQQIARSFETYDLEDTGSAFNPWRDMVKQVPSGPHSHFGDYVLTEDACKVIAELARVLDAVRPVIAASVAARGDDPSDDYADVRALRLIDGLAAREMGGE
jgi:hypothetical protein